MRESLYFGGMKIKDIENFLERSGWKQVELARRAGIEQTAFNKVLSQRRRLRVEESDRLRAIIESEETPRKPIDIRPTQPDIAESSFREIVQMPRDLPVYGTGLPDAHGTIKMGQRPMEFIRRPTVLDNVEGGYALWVRDDTMQPRYDFGEIVYVHPDRPTPPGSWVVIKLRSGTPGDGARVLIRKLVRITPRLLVVQQLNPPQEHNIDRAQVLDIDRIVQAGER